jgi:[ribosomal protein S18]-alanine N-acetyltransferase
VSARVRKAEPGDAGALVGLAEAVGAEEGRWLIAHGGWRSVPEERRYLKAIRRHAYAAVLVAELNDVIVGRLSIGRDSHPASEHVADVGLMVADGYRRRGIGRALMESAEAWARDVGVRKIELHVFPHNEAALALYDTLGYRQVGLRHGHFRRPDGYVDAILMEKDL